MSKLDVIVVYAIMQDRLGVDKLCHGMALGLRSTCAVILCTYFFGCREGWSFSQKKSIGCQLGLLRLLSTAISERQIVLECCWNTACLFSHTKNMYLLYSVRICEVVHVVGWSIAICGKAGKWRIMPVGTWKRGLANDTAESLPGPPYIEIDNFNATHKPECY